MSAQGPLTLLTIQPAKCRGDGLSSPANPDNTRPRPLTLTIQPAKCRGDGLSSPANPDNTRPRPLTLTIQPAKCRGDGLSSPNRRQVKPRPSGSRSRWEVPKRV